MSDPTPDQSLPEDPQDQADENDPNLTPEQRAARKQERAAARQERQDSKASEQGNNPTPK